MMMNDQGKLFIYAIAIGSLAMISVWLLHPFSPWFLLLYVAPALVSYCVLEVYRRKVDSLLFAPAVLLSGLGLALVARLAPELLLRQFVAYLIGLCAYLCLSLWAEGICWYRFGYLGGLAGLLLLLSASLFGAEVSGSRAWLRFWGISFQPLELFKVGLILFLAAALSEESVPIALRDRRGFFSQASLWGPTLLLWILGVIALGLQRDLGGMIVISGIFWGILYVAEGRLSSVLVGALLGFGGFASCYCLFAHVRSRLGNWFEVWMDERVYYQLKRGLFAASSGGFTGTGLGLGQPGLIPQAQTDFTLMAIWEELGLFGAVGVLTLYLLIVRHLIIKAINAHDLRHRLLSAGVGLMIGLQVLLIAGGNLGLVPLTGMTLPLVSYGGSSVIVLWAALGLTGSIPLSTRGGSVNPQSA